jgi:hypothetical protein
MRRPLLPYSGRPYGSMVAGLDHQRDHQQDHHLTTNDHHLATIDHQC